ncbi:uncharacterized protein [Macrobrachium rosenbergii]|uniref:uncharacterized protein n=1 Tax=Macrobrachium rosenbergii TaxID=79674 RepID=UPI0034D63B85
MCHCHKWCSFMVFISLLVGLKSAHQDDYASLRPKKKDGLSGLPALQTEVPLNSTEMIYNQTESESLEEQEEPHRSETSTEKNDGQTSAPRNESNLCECSSLDVRLPQIKDSVKERPEGKEWETSGELWRECPSLHVSPIVQEGFQRAVSLGLQRCAELWCYHVQASVTRQHLGGTYHTIELGYIAEEDHQCFLNITRMVILHHSWPMCSSDFICATNHSIFEMSASDCMPGHCLAAESVVLIFMILVSVCIVLMSVVIMVVIVLCPQFHKPKYYLRLSLAATDFIIGIVVCGHAAYNQWVGLTEVPLERFPHYANLRESQLFRHVPNCLWGVSDIFTQISGFFAASNMIISLYTLSLMSLDRYLLLTRTHYRSLVTSRRVTAALVISWCCGILVPSLHFVYRPQKQHELCINYDTSPLDVHIINNESKIATADYKVYLKHAVPLGVTLVVLGLPVIAMFFFSFRTLRKYNSYTRDHSVRQVKSALQLTQNHCSLSRQVSTTSLSTMVNLSAAALPNPPHCHDRKKKQKSSCSDVPGYKLKFTFKKSDKESNDPGKFVYDQGMNVNKISTSTFIESSVAPTGLGNGAIGNGDSTVDYPQVLDKEERASRWNLLALFSQNCNWKVPKNSPRTHSIESGMVADASLGASSAAGGSSRTSPSRESVLGVLGLRRMMMPPSTDHVTATIRRIRGGVIGGGGDRVTVRERDREITCTVLVNIVVFVFACFPLLAVGGWMMFLYFTQQDTINNRAPLKQLLFIAPWLMALNSLWNAVLHLTYNHKFRSATRHLLFSHWRKLFGACRRRQMYQD